MGMSRSRRRELLLREGVSYSVLPSTWQLFLPKRRRQQLDKILGLEIGPGQVALVIIGYGVSAASVSWEDATTWLPCTEASYGSEQAL